MMTINQNEEVLSLRVAGPFLRAQWLLPSTIYEPPDPLPLE